jgi:titin
MKLVLSRLILTILALALIAGPGASRIAQAAPATTFIVNESGDAGDANPGDGACATASDVCTLRAAIQEANAHSGSDVIEFDSAIVSLSPASGYPPLDDTSGGTTIHGKGMVYITSANHVDAGFTLASDGNKIQGLGISFFNDAIAISGNDNVVGVDGDGQNDATERNIIINCAGNGVLMSGNNNRVAGNYIGTNGFGIGGNLNGIRLDQGATDNLIGSNGDGVSDEQEANTISGNDEVGILITSGSGTTTRRNIVAGNLIGLNPDGDAAIPNGGYGIRIENGAMRNIIGTTGNAPDTERNIVSGNLGGGVLITGTQTISNVIAGNFIGLAANGVTALGNGREGIWIAHAANNIIGTDGDGGNDSSEGNIISGNTWSGILIYGEGAEGNVIAGNRVGVRADGTAAQPNQSGGVFLIEGASHNRVGTDGNGSSDIAERNIISGNAYNGLTIQDTTSQGNIVAGNYIGVGASGNSAIPNNVAGIWISNASSNRIGTDGNGQGDISERNIISGNGNFGIWLHEAGSADNVIAGNYIGVNANGNAALPNTDSGIRIEAGARRNLIGTNGDGNGDEQERNVIAGNSTNGIIITGVGSSGNRIAGNYIGVDKDGAGALHQYNGVRIEDGSENIVGTNGDGQGDSGEGNVISGNTHGVSLAGLNAVDNWIAGNTIGLAASGDVAVPNVTSGVYLYHAPNNIIGTDSDGLSDELEGNIISGNTIDGINLLYSGTTGNTIAGNIIGINAAGDSAIPNGDDGVSIFAAGGNAVGGPQAAQRNVISGNSGDGIILYGGSSENKIAGNVIGADAAGILAFGNGGNGIYITSGATSNLIGGAASGEGNLIAFNAGAGVRLGEADTLSNTLRGNPIFANMGLGIDLEPEGVTPNDLNDADIGPNNLQNYPTLADVLSHANGATITGTLVSAPSTTFWLDFYASESCDPAGHGEGQTYLGAGQVTTNASGSASFAITLPRYVPDETLITATATDPAGNTSEFAGCVAAETVYTPPNLTIQDASVVEGESGNVQIVFTVTLSAESNLPVSLSYATADGAANAGSDYTAKSGNLWLAPGDTSEAIVITVFGDTLNEGNEAFFVNLDNVINAIVTDGQATGTIIADEFVLVFLPLVVK